MWEPRSLGCWGAGNRLRCFRKLSRIEWLAPDGGGHAPWPRKWSQGTIPPHFLCRLSAPAAPVWHSPSPSKTLCPFSFLAPSVFHHVCFNSCDVTHAEKLWAHGRSKTLISGLKGDQSWTGVCCLIDNLQLFSFRLPSLSTTYSTCAFFSFSLLPILHLQNYCHVFISKGVLGFIFAVWRPKNACSWWKLILFTGQFTITQSKTKLLNTQSNSLSLTEIVPQNTRKYSKRKTNKYPLISYTVCVSSMRGRCGKGHTHAGARKLN